MYTIQEGMAIIANNEMAIIIAALITYGFGFIQYGTSMWMQVKNKQCPFYFWMHAWYFGHDFTFAFICFDQWFNVVHWWLFDVLCIGCMMFVCIEGFSLYRCIRYERQEVFGRFTAGREVTVRYALIRGLIGYAIGVLLFAALRATIGDPFCLFLMMSTNAILALMTQRRFDEIGHYQPGMKFLAWFTLLGTCFTFAPVGVGFFATMVPPLQGPWFTVIGLLCIASSVRAIWLAYRLSSSQAAEANTALPVQEIQHQEA